ncbi:hypothetical protein M413DRAFT_449130 [Hebeloma cylindrosporum]|uniref:Uncharacterized protein n=1 Tax=Hebeloma cylindrosporum TaxID=76867 RepID=A0A0C3BY89_HEBCY|nr:hypothetical protein M413DRAFT_449130 [Hebeloma cylindrosporum h7]
MGIFTNAKDITMHGGTFHTIGEGSNMFDNAINVQATGSRFTLENEHEISDEGEPMHYYTGIYGYADSGRL